MTHALRPLTIGELLDRTFFLYRSHFGLFVGIAALPNLLLLAVQIVRLAAEGATPPGGTGMLATFAWFLVLLIVYLITLALSQGGTVVAVSQLQLGRGTSVSEAFGAIRFRIGELAGTIFGLGVRLALGFLLLIVPGVLLAIAWSLAIPVAVLEKRPLGESLARSAELTRGHRGRILLIYTLLLILTYIVTLVLQVPTILVAAMWTTAAADGTMPALAAIAITFASFITTSLVSPIVTIALSLVYYDERVRKEAFDLEVMMHQLDQAGAPSTP